MLVLPIRVLAHDVVPDAEAAADTAAVPLAVASRIPSSPPLLSREAAAWWATASGQSSKKLWHIASCALTRWSGLYCSIPCRSGGEVVRPSGGELGELPHLQQVDSLGLEARNKVLQALATRPPPQERGAPALEVAKLLHLLGRGVPQQGENPLQLVLLVLSRK